MAKARKPVSTRGGVRRQPRGLSTRKKAPREDQQPTGDPVVAHAATIDRVDTRCEQNQRASAREVPML